MMRRFGIVVSLFLLAACGSKYPYPPQFVAPSDLPDRVLGAPPEPHSAAYARDLDTVLAEQRTLTDKDREAIMTEAHIAPEMIVQPVLGGNVTRERFPALYTLLGHAASDAWRIGDANQEYWKRTRPWLSDYRVELYAEYIDRPSYPSGHSTTNHIWAHVLSDLVPERRDALFARAHEIGWHRVEGGVHFPSDVEAGKRLAAEIYARMQRSPEFRKEFEAARQELEEARYRCRVKPAA